LKFCFSLLSEILIGDKMVNCELDGWEKV